MVIDVVLMWIVSIAVILAMVVSLIACICGCRKKMSPGSENGGLGFVGLSKMSTSNNNNTTSILAISITRTSSEDRIPVDDTIDGTVRSKCGGSQNACVPGSAMRSLPEIPVNGRRLGSQSSDTFVVYNNGSAGDTSSDLYATLDEHKAPTMSRSLRRNVTSPNGTVYSSSTPSNGVTSTTYEQINDKKNEHPYAHVQSVDENVASTSRMDVAGPSTSRQETNSPAPPLVDIPAASAITGNVAASNELPYMTPPLHHQHFSGDSQDSTKGYTSITVREPMALVMPPTSQTVAAVVPTDSSHYAFLSDDSDEMYAAIAEAYTSGSETYAQIQPPDANNLNVPSGSNVSAGVDYSSPGPSTSNNSTPRMNSAVLHSRQASSSSAASFSLSQNSPKEKRQANSPLPRPPDQVMDDMYAKVLKSHKSNKSLNANLTNSNPYSAWSNSRDSISSTPPAPVPFAELPSSPRRHQRSSSVTHPYETVPDTRYESLENEVRLVAGYETISERNNAGTPISHRRCESASDTGGYESLPERADDSITPGYERIKEPPGYEEIGRQTRMESEEGLMEPNYEELKPTSADPVFHCYATIGKRKRKNSNNNETQEGPSEPDYATLRRDRHEDDEDDPAYERLSRRTESRANASDSIEVQSIVSNAQHSSVIDVSSSTANEQRSGNSSSVVDIQSTSGARKLSRNHSVSENDLSALYSKVNKNVKR